MANDMEVTSEGGKQGLPNLDVLERHHHGPDSSLPRLALGKQVPKLEGARGDGWELSAR